MIKIAPSVLAAPMMKFGESIAMLNSNDVDYLHLDVMDGHFVPQISFGEEMCAAFGNASKIPLDIHLMVEAPEREVPKYFEIKPEYLTFHYEATSFPIRLSQTIRNQGIKSGIALNPLTPIGNLAELYPYFDLFLIMSIEPGYYGQKFLDTTWYRLAQLAELRAQLSKKFNHYPVIEVDGGVNDKNIKLLADAGVDIAVAGSFVFKSEQPNEQVRLLKNK